LLDRRSKWTEIGRDTPASKAALAQREAAKMQASKPKDTGATVIVPAAKRSSPMNTRGKGR